MKKKDVKDRSEISNYFSDLLVVFLIILVFALIDSFVHSLSAEYAVPDYYFRNKIIFGTIIGFITYLFIKNKKLLTKSLILSLVVSVLLQIRYALEGYDLNFIFEFLFLHFFMLLISSLLVFKIIKIKKFDKNLKGGKKR